MWLKGFEICLGIESLVYDQLKIYIMVQLWLSDIMYINGFDQDFFWRRRLNWDRKFFLKGIIKLVGCEFGFFDGFFFILEDSLLEIEVNFQERRQKKRIGKDF